MSSLTHSELVQQEHDGKLLIGIDRPFARRFYTDTPIAAVLAETGEAPYFEKLTIFPLFVGGPLLLLSASISAAIFFGWWAVLTIPVFIFIWMLYYSASSHGRSRSIGISIVLVCCFIVSFTSLIPFSFGVTFSLFFASLWCSRVLYSASTMYLRCFILRNARAFEMLRDEITLKELA
jgi:hypothetical protein